MATNKKPKVEDTVHQPKVETKDQLPVPGETSQSEKKSEEEQDEKILPAPSTKVKKERKITGKKEVKKEEETPTVKPAKKTAKKATTKEAPEPPISAEAKKSAKSKEIKPTKGASKKQLKVKQPNEQRAAIGAAMGDSKPLLTAAPIAVRIRKIVFQIRYHTKIGENIFVTGDNELLGNNDPEKAFALQYLNEEYWFGELEIPDGALNSVFAYKYLVKNQYGIVNIELVSDKVFDPLQYNIEEVRLVDAWNFAGHYENSFLTEPFKNVLFKNNYNPGNTQQPTDYSHIFRVKAPLLQKNQAVAIFGSTAQLGKWDLNEPLLLSKKEGGDWWTLYLDLSTASYPITYKYGIYDTDTRQLVQLEGDKNRVVYDGAGPDKLTILSDGFAVFDNKTFKGAGVAIPVFSLRTNESFGLGEFNDIKLLVDWAKMIGLKVIQILPVNDTIATHTWVDSYPYAAISAFALHPVFLHLPGIVNDGNRKLLQELEATRVDLNHLQKIDYERVVTTKLNFVRKIFPSQKQATFNSQEFISFFKDNNHWLVPYAAFSYLRDEFGTPDFTKWSEHSQFNQQDIEKLAASPAEAQDEISIHYFTQFHLHLQLKNSTEYAHQNGIIVKGDIPIGIYRNSADAWQEPGLYNMDMQAGAPPDDFAIKGQNWGFPTYNWQQMQRDGFAWWKKRFAQMSYYFDAFRIDHILGFFRIWSIPMHSVEGIMGTFVPSLPVHKHELEAHGIYTDTSRLTLPYINEHIVRQEFGDLSQSVKQAFLNDNGYEHYVLKPEFDTQRKVQEHFKNLPSGAENDRLKYGLFNLISNVILFEAEGGNDQFHFRIEMESTSSFRYLDEDTQARLKQLYVNYFFRRQDQFWRDQAMQKLPELKRSTNMLICGEDLGMVPDCVPGVMKQLGILSLEIQRMPKDPTREFFHPNDAPYLSVVTPSTHDMSTIRGWWEEDHDKTLRFYHYQLGKWGDAPYFCEPDIAQAIIVQHLYSPAMWSIFQLQDLLAMDGAIRGSNPADERINVPANPKHYWQYRMHLTIEDLMEQTAFNHNLQTLIAESGR